MQLNKLNTQILTHFFAKFHLLICCKITLHCKLAENLRRKSFKIEIAMKM